MKNIVVVEAISTGKNYVDDIAKLGYYPVVLEIKPSGNETADNIVFSSRRACYGKMRSKFDIVSEGKTYAETLEKIRAYDPVIVIPGSEWGVDLATHLADDLGLIGNPYSGIDKMTKKNVMQDALKAAGLRYIKSAVIRNEEEAIAFFEALGKEDVVVKPAVGGGSVGVHLCHGREEMLKAVRFGFSERNIFGKLEEYLILQEQIIGTEFIVNTLSSNGKHYITSSVKYTKTKVAGGGSVYRSSEFISDIRLEHYELFKYALAVADAIGIKYGPIHGEYMIDADGPVLIEVNCRPMGGNLAADFLDAIYGQHETDSALDAYLFPEKFEEASKRPWKKRKKGYLKFFIAPSDMSIDESPVVGILPKLKSYHSASTPSAGYDNAGIVRTIDLETAAGSVYLLHEDEQIAENECELLTRIEDNCFSLLYRNSGSKDPQKYERVPENELCASLDLVFGDKKYTRLDDSSKLEYAKDLYDDLVIDFSPIGKCGGIEEFVDIFFRLAQSVKAGGKLVVTENTYSALKNGSAFICALIELANATVELPYVSAKNVIVASFGRK